MGATGGPRRWYLQVQKREARRDPGSLQQAPAALSAILSILHAKCVQSACDISRACEYAHVGRSITDSYVVPVSGPLQRACIASQNTHLLRSC